MPYDEKAYMKQYRKDNYEQIKLKALEWHKNNLQKMKAYMKVYNKNYKQNNREKVNLLARKYGSMPKRKIYLKKYRQEHLEERKQYDKKNRERINFLCKERRHKKGISKRYNTGILNLGNRKEYGKSYGKLYREKLPKGKHAEEMRKWRKENPIKAKMQRQAYRVNRQNAGKLTIQTIQSVYEDNIKRYGTLTCYLCLKQIQFGKDHLEHKIPLSKGGTNDYENLAVACQKCNCKKHNRTETEYRNLTIKELS